LHITAVKTWTLLQQAQRWLLQHHQQQQQQAVAAAQALRSRTWTAFTTLEYLMGTGELMQRGIARSACTR
jgi:hypothetical protein